MMLLILIDKGPWYSWALNRNAKSILAINSIVQIFTYNYNYLRIHQTLGKKPLE
ncbi:MAG: hypothetical protein QXI49_06845 [Candidatus Methanomethylicaceae archaeon]